MGARAFEDGRVGRGTVDENDEMGSEMYDKDV